MRIRLWESAHYVFADQVVAGRRNRIAIQQRRPAGERMVQKKANDRKRSWGMKLGKRHVGVLLVCDRRMGKQGMLEDQCSGMESIADPTAGTMSTEGPHYN